MTAAFPALLILPALIMLATICLSNSWSNTHVRPFRKFVAFITGVQFVVATVFMIEHLIGYVPLIHAVLISLPNDSPIAITVYYDGVASLMLTLVSFVGWVICRFSIRYLDGEATQGRYFRWTAFTIGAVSLMVVSGNLLMFLAAWIMTSLGLHQLLLHYPHRPAANRAARTKFIISRFGDAALIGVMFILYSEFKTLDFSELFAAANALETVTPNLQLASFLLVIGAVTKSAQFPFHTWLPLTMETPTPVSALMHAGIVNAGGYLIVRTSPFVSLAPSALITLAIVGGFTACFASVVMLTQTSVKKSLAFSTIAQMGFMLLQCGLGAFSAAMLHILAHSLYKAHAFLSSGNVMAERDAMNGAPRLKYPVSLGKLGFAGVLIIGLLGLSFALFGIDPIKKSGGLLLGGVICLALTHWVGQVMRTGSRGLILRSIMIAGGLCLVYSATFVAVDIVIAESLPKAQPPQIYWVTAIVLAGFFGLFGLHVLLASGRGRATLNRWHIHASNGFYLENRFRRLFGSFLRA